MKYALLTATHSIISTYLGSMTIVLKLPLTRAASANGLQRYSGFELGTSASVIEFCRDNDPVGVGDRLGRRLENALILSENYR